jgi:signal transduction histidine kinase
MHASDTRSWTPRDVVVALVAFALTMGLLAAARGSARSIDLPGVLLAAAATLPLVLHRRGPLAIFAVTTAASAAVNALGYQTGPPFGPTVALFYVANDDRTRSRIGQTAAVVFGMFAVHLAATSVAEDAFPTTPILFGVVVWGAAWGLGDGLRGRRARQADMAERAARARRDTARERRLAAAEERTRIARDLHDSAAHAINVILVQAGAARLLQDRDPEAARSALTTIEDVARETIGEIDQLVRGLRDDAAGEEAVEPPTGLGALDTLVERHRTAGIAVDVRVDGRPRPLPAGVDQAAYRILQESLTNAARHGCGEAGVRIAYGDSRLVLEVANPVAPSAAPAPMDGGHGILGMRERAALLGGTLEVHRGDGRFRVRAALPYGPGEDPR